MHVATAKAGKQTGGKNGGKTGIKWIQNDRQTRRSSLLLAMLESSWWPLALAVFCGALYYNLLHRRRYKTNALPGPVRLPLIGHSSLWGKALYKEFESLAAKYGDVFGLYLGNKYAVVLSDYSALKQVLLDKAIKPTANGFVESKSNVEDANGNKELIKEEISYFLAEIEKQGSEPLPVTHALITSTADAICDLIYPKKLQENNPKRKKLREVVLSLTKHIHPPDSHVPFNEQNVPAIWDADKLYVVTQEVIKAVRQETVNGYNHNEILQSCSIENANIERELTKKIDFLLQTASSSVIAVIEWTLLALATQPEVQEKCVVEIDKSIGRKNFPDWNERHHLSYVIATCMEAQRLYCIHPVALVKQTTHDIPIGEYHIPKDSFLLSNIWTILHDPLYWLAPDQFHPERFLNSNRKDITQPEFYIPLSFDNSGNTLADVLVFTYVVCILQRFTIEPHPIDEEPDMEGKIEIVHRPYLFDLMFIPRE